MNLKRLFLTIVAIVMATADVRAVEVSINGLKFYANPELKTAELVKPGTSSTNYYIGNLVIPDQIEVEGIICKVTRIGDNACTKIFRGEFQPNNELRSVAIPESVETIGYRAFYFCNALQSILIPRNVTSIGEYAFKSNENLKTVIIESRDIYIGDNAFSGSLVLEDFYLYTESFPKTGENVFDKQRINNATLHVRKSNIPFCESASPWNEFGLILPLPELIYVVDGDIYKTNNPIIGELITPEPEPIKEGYTFSGWSEIPETMPEHDVTVTGSFTVNTYKLSYFVDGQHVLTTGVNYGDPISPLEEPTKEGYTFSGWSEIPATMPAHDVDIMGSFTVNTYKLSYFVDDQHVLTTGVNYGDQITPLEEPTKEGYTFSGWSEIPATMPNHDVTITGSFTINQYQLTLKVGDNVYETQTLDYGAPITLPEMPELTGYTFAWGEVPETMPAGDVTIVGEYKPNSYNVTYLIDGQFYAIVKVQFGSAITTPDVPEREGSTFTWGDYPTTMPAHDIIIEGTYTDGVNDVRQNSNQAEFYSLDGKKMKRMQRGVNIVRRGSRILKVVMGNEIMQ